MIFIKILIMMSRISNFFTESGQVILNPDDFLYYKCQSKGYNGILTLIFYHVILALIIGITTKDLVTTLLLVAIAIIFPLVYRFIKSIFVYAFAKLLGGTGSFMNTFNLTSYSSVLNILIILGFALTFFDKLVIIPILLLVYLWKMVIEIIAVSEEHNIGYGKSFLANYGIFYLIVIILVGLL